MVKTRRRPSRPASPPCGHGSAARPRARTSARRVNARPERPAAVGPSRRAESSRLLRQADPRAGRQPPASGSESGEDRRTNARQPGTVGPRQREGLASDLVPTSQDVGQDPQQAREDGGPSRRRGAPPAARLHSGRPPSTPHAHLEATRTPSARSLRVRADERHESPHGHVDGIAGPVRAGLQDGVPREPSHEEEGVERVDARRHCEEAKQERRGREQQRRRPQGRHARRRPRAGERDRRRADPALCAAWRLIRLSFRRRTIASRRGR